MIINLKKMNDSTKVRVELEFECKTEFKAHMLFHVTSPRHLSPTLD
jgi:hypothetical protein